MPQFYIHSNPQVLSIPLNEIADNPYVKATHNYDIVDDLV